MATKALSVAPTLVVIGVTAAGVPNLEGVFSHREEEGAVQTLALASTVTYCSSPRQEMLNSRHPIEMCPEMAATHGTGHMIGTELV